MQKKADSNYLNMALASLLTGGGIYAGARALKDLNTTLNPTDPTQNELNITLPKSRIPKKVDVGGVDKYANAMVDWLNGGMEYLAPTAIGAGGVYAGFKGAQGIHSAIKNKSINDEQEAAKQEYLKSLQMAAHKTASYKADTPNVDAFIRGIVEKQANALTEDWSIMDSLGGIGKSVGEGAKYLGNKFIHSEPGKLSAAAVMGTTGASALATYYLANRMDRNKAEAQNKSNIPTEVKLHVQ